MAEVAAEEAIACAEHRARGRPSTLALVGAFAAIYVIWGSTYLAIKFAVETLPPLLMAGARFLLAGSVLYAWVRWRGAEQPTAAHWRRAGLVGLLMLMGGNGLVCWAELTIPSGLAALLIATVPLWLALFDWCFFSGPRPGWLIVLGLLLGLVGIYLLIGPSAFGGQRIDLFGAGLVLVACVFWSLGSLAMRRLALPKSIFLSTAMQMLVAGAGLILMGMVRGEGARFALSAISLKSLISLAYLSVFGSIVALSAYGWLMQVSTPARVGTYAYVNPVIAVALGALLANEPLTPRMLIAAAIILGAVAMISMSRPPATRP